MKKLIALLLGVTVLLSLAACGNSVEKTEEDDAQIPNPFANCDTLEDAAAISGFDMTAPDSIDGYSNRIIQAVENEMVQVIYGDSDNTVILRKAVGEEDVSGDYNSYTQTNEAAINNMKVTFKGDNNLVNVAIWTQDGYSFAIDIDGEGLSAEAVTALVQAMG